MLTIKNLLITIVLSLLISTNLYAENLTTVKKVKIPYTPKIEEYRSYTYLGEKETTLTLKTDGVKTVLFQDTPNYELANLYLELSCILYNSYGAYSETLLYFLDDSKRLPDLKCTDGQGINIMIKGAESSDKNTYQYVGELLIQRNTEEEDGQLIRMPLDPISPPELYLPPTTTLPQLGWHSIYMPRDYLP